MKFKKVTILVSAFLLLGSSVAFSANTQTVKATISNLKYTLNGKNWTAKSTDKPVVINGTTYLPISVIKEATKTNVSVDTKTGKINIGEKGKKTPFQEVSIEYYSFNNTRNKTVTTINGVNYNEVLYSNFSSFAHEYLKPNSNYQTLHLDLYSPESIIEVSAFETGTDRSLGNILVEPGNITTLDLNIASVTRVRLEAKRSEGKNHELIILPTSYYK